MNRPVRLGVVVVTVLACGQMTLAQVPRGESASCGPTLERLLVNKKLVAKVVFPASAQGIDLTLDGRWDQKETSRLIKRTGVGIAVDDPAVVNQVKLKDNLLELHLNGGGFGTFGDVLLSSEYQRQTRSTGEKASGGSRVNLRFTRPVTCEELTDAEQMMRFLEPLLDASALRIVAAQQAIAPEWAEDARFTRVVIGMDKATVFAIMGEPKQKHVNLETDPPTERWQFDLPDLRTRVVTFQAGKVVKVDEF
jgi:hypothetical protein